MTPIVTEAIAAASEATAQPKKISVTLKRKNNGYPEIKSNYKLPNSAAVQHWLPEDARKIAQPFYYFGIDLTDWILSTAGVVNGKVWTRAITKAIEMALADSALIQTEKLAFTSPAYLAMGNAVFQLNVTDITPLGLKAMPVIRKRIADEARLEAEAVVNKATEEAQLIRDTAQHDANVMQRRVSTAQQELARINTNISNLAVCPEWIRNAGYAIRYISMYDERGNLTIKLELLCHMSFTITTFYAGLRVWQAVPPLPNVTFPLWIELNTDDTYQYNRLHIDKHFPHNHPHIDHDHACVSLSDAPPLINSTDTLVTLAGCMRRVMSRIHLQSLLCGYSSWHPDFKAAVPAVLRDYLAGITLIHTRLSSFEDIPCDVIQPEVTPPAIFTVPTITTAPAIITPGVTSDALDAGDEEDYEEDYDSVFDNTNDTEREGDTA